MIGKLRYLNFYTAVAAPAATAAGLSLAAPATLGLSLAPLAIKALRQIGNGRRTANTFTGANGPQGKLNKELAEAAKIGGDKGKAYAEKAWRTFLKEGESFASKGKVEQEVFKQALGTPDLMNTVKSMLGADPFSPQFQPGYTAPQTQVQVPAGDMNVAHNLTSNLLGSGYTSTARGLPPWLGPAMSIGGDIVGSVLGGGSRSLPPWLNPTPTQSGPMSEEIPNGGTIGTEVIGRLPTDPTSPTIPPISIPRGGQGGQGGSVTNTVNVGDQGGFASVLKDILPLLANGGFNGLAAWLASDAAKDAGEKVGSANDRAALSMNEWLELVRGQQTKNEGALNPYIDTGTNALKGINDPSLTAGFDKAFDPNINLEDDPGFKARMKKAIDALESSASAKGVINSGGTRQMVFEKGADVGSQEYQAAYGRKIGEYGLERDTFYKNQANKADTLFKAADLGRGSVVDQSNIEGRDIGALGTALGAQNSLGIDAATARASGGIAAGNAWQQALQSIGNNIFSTWGGNVANQQEQQRRTT